MQKKTDLTYSLPNRFVQNLGSYFSQQKTKSLLTRHFTVNIQSPFTKFVFVNPVFSKKYANKPTQHSPLQVVVPLPHITVYSALVQVQHFLTAKEPLSSPSAVAQILLDAREISLLSTRSAQQLLYLLCPCNTSEHQDLC